MQNTDYKPRVEDEQHRSLEDRVRAYLEESGYALHEATYHATMPEWESDILKKRYSMTALYLRGRADRIAFHLVLPVEFEWEAKTHANGKYEDLTIELLPLIHHIAKAGDLGVRCLYVFDVKGREGGFWVHQLPRVRQIYLPPRPDYLPVMWHFENLCEKYFRGIPVNKNGVSGSGDPFVVFDKSVIRGLRHWKDLIDEVTK